MWLTAHWEEFCLAGIGKPAPLSASRAKEFAFTTLTLKKSCCLRGTALDLFDLLDLSDRRHIARGPNLESHLFFHISPKQNEESKGSSKESTRKLLVGRGGESSKAVFGASRRLSEGKYLLRY